MHFIIIFFILLFQLNKGFGSEIVLNAVAFSRKETGQIYTPLVNKFNEYSKKNDLGIRVNLNLLTSENITYSINDYGSMVEALLKKRNKKYILYFYDNLYLPKYGEYLLDLKDLLPKEHVQMHNQKIVSDTCYYKNKLVGLPAKIGLIALYYNEKYLTKYNKKVPTTWEELLNTAKDIIREEKKNNNTEIYGYNGLFDNGEQGFCSIYEFIYSYRNSTNDPFPDLRSKEAADALKMMKRLKNEISTDEMFRSGEVEASNNLFKGRDIFIKFWIFQKPTINKVRFTMAPLPGNKDGVSAALLSGYNLGIINDLDERTRNAAITAFKFLTSKEMQKMIVLEDLAISSISSLYDDEEVCKVANCPLIKKMQPIGRPTNRTNNYDKYSERYRNYVYEYLYGNGNRTAEAVLADISDMTDVYYILSDSSTRTMGILNIVVVSIVIGMMILSLSFLYIKNLEKLYKFLTKEFWIMSVTGAVLMLSSCFTQIGKVTVNKCFILPILISLGYTLNLVPIFHKLLTLLLPDEPNFTNYIIKIKYIFNIVFLIMDFILIGLLFITPYEVEDIIIDKGKNFQVCKMNSIFGMFIIVTLFVIKIIVILGILVLIFLEWFVPTKLYELKFIVVTIYINILSLIILFILDMVQIKNFISYSLLRELIIFIISLSNYLFIYGYRILFNFKKEAFESIVSFKSISSGVKIIDTSKTNNTTINMDKTKSSC